MSNETPTQYPHLEIAPLDVKGAIGGVQFFPRSDSSSLSMGHALVQYTEATRWAFDDRVTHWNDFYANTKNVRPEFVDGAVYIENAFGALFGPLDSSADDPQACIEEAIEMFGMGNVVDKRTSDRS